MHLVPARLVPGTAAYTAAQQPQQAAGDNAEGVEQPAAQAAGAAGEPPAAAAAAAQEAAPAGLAGSSRGTSPPRRRAQHAPQMSLDAADLVAGEGLECGGGGDGPAPGSPSGQQPPGTPQSPAQQEAATEPMLLLDCVPQTAYGRIKLCPSVMRHHIIPSCALRGPARACARCEPTPGSLTPAPNCPSPAADLRSLHSALAGMPQAGVPPGEQLSEPPGEQHGDGSGAAAQRRR